MFTKSKNSQGDLFSGMGSHLSSRKNKLLSDPNSWHQVFWREVTSRIDEAPYSVLYSQTQGRPNSSIRVLIGMMILKEGNGWSDAQLFEEARFNLQVMQALGFVNLDEDVPVESTYYEFRSLVHNYKEEKGLDLIEGCFKQITADQIKSYNISGKKIRLDSKLLQSNISHSTRVHLVLEGIRVRIRKLDIISLKEKLDEDQYELLVCLKEKTTSNITYSLDKQGEQKALQDAGYIIKALLEQDNGDWNDTLLQIYNEQYKEEQGEEPGATAKDERLAIKVKTPNEIQSNSVQSIHDPQAAYRKKGKGHSSQTVSGYHANITETCDPEDPINLVCSVEVKPANICENEFLLPAIKSTEEVLSKPEDEKKSSIEEVITDGGYDSIENRKTMSEAQTPNWSLAKFKGRQRAYHMEYGEQGQVIIKDKKTLDPYAVKYIDKKGKYRIKTKKGTYRYWTKEEIGNYIASQSLLDNFTEESYNLRANVESTIHQVFHRIKNRQKIVYRGLTKSHWYVVSRALWVNSTRIGKYLQEMSIFSTLLIYLPLWLFISSIKPKKQIFKYSCQGNY